MTAGVRTFAWLSVLAAATAAAVYFATVPEQPASTASSLQDNQGAMTELILVPLQSLAGITIVHGGKAHEFVRDKSARWFLHGAEHHHGEDGTGHHGAHPQSAADTVAEQIGKAFDMFAVTRIERIVTTGPADPRFGTVDPEMVILLYRQGQARPFRRILVGDVAPDSLGRYALLQDQQSTVIVADYQIRNLLQLLASLDVRDNPLAPARSHSHD